MISKFVFVLFIGKFVSYIYNLIQSKIALKHDVEHTFERKVICKKTASALLCETVTYGLIAIIALIFKI